MTDHDAMRDELVSAYLAGDLDPEAEADFERQMADDPALVERVEAMHDLLVDLRGLDDVVPPEGYAQRLRDRLDAAGTGQDTAEVVPLVSRRRTWWLSAGAAAAVVALVAVVVVVPGLVERGGLGGEAAGPAAPEQAFLEELDDDGVGEATRLQEEDRRTLAAGSDAEDSGVVAEAAIPPPDEPVLVDGTANLEDTDAVREHFLGPPEVEGLLGVPLAEAEDLAARFRLVIQRAEAFPSGAHPAECLDVVTGGGQGPLVPARVEALRYGDDPALAYVLIGATAGAEVLDRAEVWVVERVTCATREFLTL